MSTKPLDKLIRDKHGRIVIWQWPNLLLWSWIILKILVLVLPKGQAKDGAGHLGTAVLFAWAYLELVQGVTVFRKILGGAVIAVLVVGFFM